MVNETIQIAAGTLASLIFVASNVPMLFKVLKTRSLQSYSWLHIAMANGGNGLYWLYVVGLPPGPIWALHLFNTAVSLTMLWLYLRYEVWHKRPLPLRRRLMVMKTAVGLKMT